MQWIAARQQRGVALGCPACRVRGMELCLSNGRDRTGQEDSTNAHNENANNAHAVPHHTDMEQPALRLLRPKGSSMSRICCFWLEQIGGRFM